MSNKDRDERDKPGLRQDLTALIDSAKREAYKQGYIDAGIKALTEQSEESLMSSTQEKLEEMLEVHLNFMAAEILIPHISLLINQARKEGAIEELERLKGIDCFNEPYTWQGDGRPGKLVDIRIKQLKGDKP